jgi:hypothetical protein
MFDGAQHAAPLRGVAAPPANAAQPAGSEVLQQQVAKIQEAQKRLLASLQNNQLPLSQVAAEMARLESELVQAQRGLKHLANIPA